MFSNYNQPVNEQMIMKITILVKNENKSQLQRHMKKRVSCSGVQVMTPLIITNCQLVSLFYLPILPTCTYLYVPIKLSLVSIFIHNHCNCQSLTDGEYFKLSIALFSWRIEPTGYSNQLIINWWSIFQAKDSTI